METFQLLPVAGKPNVFTTELNGERAVVAFRSEDRTNWLKNCHLAFREKEIEDAAAFARKQNIPAFVGVLITLEGEFFESYLMPMYCWEEEKIGWCFPLSKKARGWLAEEEEIVKGFRVEIVPVSEQVAA